MVVVGLFYKHTAFRPRLQGDAARKKHLQCPGVHCRCSVVHGMGWGTAQPGGRQRALRRFFRSICFFFQLQYSGRVQSFGKKLTVARIIRTAGYFSATVSSVL